MKHIETYRGIDIYFDTNKDQFTYSLDDRMDTRQSYAVCKTKIDEYWKNNQNFEPFYVEDCYGKGITIKIVGVRKDNRFVYENHNGKKEQLSEWDENDWMEINPDNDPIKKELQEIDNKIEKLESERANTFDQLKRKFLSEIKKEILK